MGGERGWGLRWFGVGEGKMKSVASAKIDENDTFVELENL